MYNSCNQVADVFSEKTTMQTEAELLSKHVKLQESSQLCASQCTNDLYAMRMVV